MAAQKQDRNADDRYVQLEELDPEELQANPELGRSADRQFVPLDEPGQARPELPTDTVVIPVDESKAPAETQQPQDLTTGVSYPSIIFESLLCLSGVAIAACFIISFFFLAGVFETPEEPSSWYPPYYPDSPYYPENCTNVTGDLNGTIATNQTNQTC